MPAFPVDPYVTEVADALKAAGHEVTDVWTEATDPVDHNIRIQVEEAALVLIWDEVAQWTWITYLRPTATYSDAGRLFANYVRPHPSEVVAEVGLIVNRIIYG